LEDIKDIKTADTRTQPTIDTAKEQSPSFTSVSAKLEKPTRDDTMKTPTSVTSNRTSVAEATAPSSTTRESTRLLLNATNRERDSGSNATANDSPLVAWYQEPFTQTWKSVNESQLSRLGFSFADAASLRADALDLIVQENITKPRSGIPARWKVSADSSLQITVQSAKDPPPPATPVPRVTERPRSAPKNPREILPLQPRGQQQERAVSRQSESSNRESRVREPSASSPSAATERPPPSLESPIASTRDKDTTQRTKLRDDVDATRARDMEDTTAHRTPRPSSRSRIGVEGKDDDELKDKEGDAVRKSSRVPPRLLEKDNEEERPARRPERAAGARDETRRRRTAAVDEEGRPKRIYSGRPAPPPPGRQRGDPPPPKGFWPDIDSFRSMLRNEAGMRLRILGDEWEQSVKDESDWRLNLYKDWLWMLHNGVGEPIVESRNDRMRRDAAERRPDLENPRERRSRRNDTSKR
jgi:hypothetical protein